MIFGTGSFAECVHYLLTHDSDYEVVAFTATGEHAGRELLGLPVVPFESVERELPPSEFEMYVAVAYRQLNRLRASIFEQAKGKGYRLLTYISSRATYYGAEIGENCFVFEENTIQPFVRIGDDVVLWSGNHIGHHSLIGDHVFIASHVVVSGHVSIGPYTFIGVNATLRDGIRVGEACLIGAGALLLGDAADREVYPGTRTRPSERRSDELDF